MGAKPFTLSDVRLGREKQARVAEFIALVMVQSLRMESNLGWEPRGENGTEFSVYNLTVLSPLKNFSDISYLQGLYYRLGAISDNNNISVQVCLCNLRYIYLFVRLVYVGIF